MGVDSEGVSMAGISAPTVVPDRGASAKSAHAQRMLGLDGLRGAAVILVVAFHLWPAVVPGGFVGVSLFFTLSGFVITRGLLGEIGRSSSVRLRAFWGRRLRRLWPAAVITLVLIMTIWALWGKLTPAIGGDIGASFAQVANWRFLSSGNAYGTTADASPVAHFWSLAIEEQYYLIIPLVAWACRRSPTLLGAALVAIVGGSMLATFANSGNSTVVYYSTFTRAAEIAIGGLLAVGAHFLVRHRVTRPAPVLVTRSRLAATRVGLICVGVAGAAALVWASLATSLGTSFYYRGGLTLLAAGSAAAIIAAVWCAPFVRALSWRPLVWMGAVSYAVYLFHWPLHIAFAQFLSAAIEPWVTVAVTLALAALSLYLIEIPVRERRVPIRVLVPTGLAIAAALSVGCLIAINADPPVSQIDFASAASEFASMQNETATGTVAVPLTFPAGSAKGTEANPIRAAFFGDSTAMTLALGAGGGTPGIKSVGGAGGLGCALGRGGMVRGFPTTGDDWRTEARKNEDSCDWSVTWPVGVAKSSPVDVAVVLTGNWDIAGRKIVEAGNTWTTVGDPQYDEWLLAEISGAADSLHAAGAGQVLWLTLPTDVGAGSNSRADGFNAMIRTVASSRNWMTVGEYAGYLSSLSPSDQWHLRPDARHLSAVPDLGTAGEFSRTWLDPLLFSMVR